MRVLAASYNIGGVKALEPAVSALIKQGHHVKYVCSVGDDLGNVTLRYLRERGMPFSAWREEEMDVDIVMVGTSASDISIDKTVTMEGRNRGLPVVAVCNFWGSMDLRFGASGEFLPTHVTVVDEAAKQQVEQYASLRGKTIRIGIKGNPSWDDLGAMKHYYRRQNVRSPIIDKLEGYGIDLERPLILFGSQPIASRYGDACGYNEKESKSF